MQRYYYDLHVHTALSPCADDDMTPGNILGMAEIIGLKIIAITDHNSIGNVQSVMNAAKNMENAPLVIAGMELETSESIHVIMLFPNFESAQIAQKTVDANMMKIKNKVNIYGRQIYYNPDDTEAGEEENLLVVSTNIDLEGAKQLAKINGGIAIPAHINRQSNSVISVLGDITTDMGFKTVEVYANVDRELTERLMNEKYKLIYDSDSHNLGTFNELGKNYLELDKLSAENVIKVLTNI